MGKREGRVVEKYDVPGYGISVDIRLLGDLTFYAEVWGETFKNKDGAALKQELYEYIKANSNIEWKSIIRISHNGYTERAQEAEFKFEYERFWYAKVGDKCRELSWGTYEAYKDKPERWLSLSYNRYRTIEDSLKQRNVNYGSSRNGESYKELVKEVEGEVFRPYSEELWAGLGKLKETINQAHARIMELISTEKGNAYLMSGGKLLLESEDLKTISPQEGKDK